MRYDAESGGGREDGIGVLLANLGTPDAPTPAALRKYLAEFLWDPRVIEPPPPRWLWWLILHGIVLRVRPAKSAKLYASVWTPDGSPLLAVGRRQARGLGERLRARTGARVEVELAMRYGNPSIAAGLDALRDRGCRRVLVLPLYPQYAGATVGSTFDGVAAALVRRRRVPELRMVADYHLERGYIEALAASVREFWAANGEPEKLMMSFHGLPERYVRSGDPYRGQCEATARALAEALGLGAERWMVTFQSRFGKEPWLQPYTDKTLERLGREGVRRVDVMAPGFAADCLETLEELAVTNRELFEAAGGEHLRYIPALNDRADHLDALADVAARGMAGWMGGGGRLVLGND